MLQLFYNVIEDQKFYYSDHIQVEPSYFFGLWTGQQKKAKNKKQYWVG